MINGGQFSEIPLYSAIRTTARLALIKECWVLSIISPCVNGHHTDRNIVAESTKCS